MAATVSWEGSAQPSNPTVSTRLPEEVVTCLKNARFLHLATCIANRPHVSLMNYTYLPSYPHPSSTLSSGPLIIMTSNPSSKKTINLLQNPNVSLLVHDWVSARPPPTLGSRERSPPGSGRSSSLAAMLMQMNSSAVSSISATINGEAIVLEEGSDEEKWCKDQHLANNTFDSALPTNDRLLSNDPDSSHTTGDGGRGSYIEDDDVRVVVVMINDGRISDWKGGVKDWKLADTGLASTRENPTVNGVLEVA